MWYGIKILKHNLTMLMIARIDKILFRASGDGGSTFISIKTLSINASGLTSKIAALPTIVMIVIYVVWNVGFPFEDFYRNSDDIFFTKSNDNGDSFSNLTKIGGFIKEYRKTTDHFF